MSLTSFPGLREHDERMAHIAKDHWRQHESYADHAERVARCTEAATWYFNAATKPQREAYRRAMEDLRGLYSPKAHRAREAAEAAWYASTERARELLERTFEDFMRDGEIAESTSDLWDELAVEASKKDAA